MSLMSLERKFPTQEHGKYIQATGVGHVIKIYIYPVSGINTHLRGEENTGMTSISRQFLVQEPALNIFRNFQHWLLNCK